MSTPTPPLPHLVDERHDDVVGPFLQARPRLLRIAARVLDRGEAEDVVQEAWVRWRTCDRAVVANPTAFLVTTTTRLAINTGTSARARRERRLGPSQPERAGRGPDPAAAAEGAEALTVALGLLLERLTPGERAAYLLRQAFGYAYADIAALLDLTEVNARQLVSRAGRHLATGRRQPVHADDRRRLALAFRAATGGDLAPLEHLLATAARPAPAPATAVRAA